MKLKVSLLPIVPIVLFSFISAAPPPMQVVDSSVTNSIDSADSTKLEEILLTLQVLHDDVQKQTTVMELLKSFQMNLQSGQDHGCGVGNWTASYKNKKCYKVLEKPATHQEAEELCKEEVGKDQIVPEILEIKSQQEQDFINSRFKLKNGSPVWLSAKRSSTNEFIWADKSKLTFSDWVQNAPSNNTDQECSEFSFNSAGNAKGTWRDVSCQKWNAIICQKPSARTLWETQQLVEDMRLDLQKLKNDPVPRGFIYVQLPNQQAPTVLWPNLVWEEITPAYAGVFFRALGGNSAVFGATQGENAPRLTSVSSHLIGYQQQVTTAHEVKNVNVPLGGTSQRLWTGDDVSGLRPLIQTSFTNSGGEVRPRNMAVKIWRRKN